MNIKIRETGERKSLVIRSENGIEWTNDLIGNAGAFIDGQFAWSEEDDAYLADQSTYDWWAKYISEQDATEEDIDLLASKLGIDKSVIREAIAANTGSDYEQHRREAVEAMDEIRDEYAVTTAAATLGRKGGKSTSAAKTDAARLNGKRGGRPRKQP